MKKFNLPVMALVFLLAALAWTWPLVANLTMATPYASLPRPGLERVQQFGGDQLQFYYRLWLFYDSLQEGRLFHPIPYEFNGNMGKPLLSSQFMPFSFLFALLAPFGITLAYNLTLLLTFPLTALCTYLLVRRLGGDAWGGLAGAFICAFFPYRVAQAMAGHPNGFLFFVLPLFFWLLEEYLATGRPRWAWLAGLALFAQGVMELHAALFTFVALIVYLPIRWMIPTTRWLRYSRGSAGTLRPVLPRWQHFLAPLAVTLFRLAHASVAAGPSASAILSACLWGAAVAAAQTVAIDAAASVWGLERSVSASYVLPLTRPLLFLPIYGLKLVHPIPMLGRGLAILVAAGMLLELWRVIPSLRRARPVRVDLRALFQGRMHGFLAMAASAAASAVWLQSFRALRLAGTRVDAGRSLREVMLFTPQLADVTQRANPDAEFYLYLGVVALAVVAAGIIAVRMRPKAGGTGWVLPLYGLLGAGFYFFALGPAGGNLLPLFKFMRHYLPFMNYPRVTSRALILVAPLLAVTVGLGLTRLRRAIPGRFVGGLLTAGLLAAMVADYLPTAHPGLSFLPERNRAYETTVPTPGTRLLDVPIWPGDSAWSSIYQYWVTRYRHMMLNGYSPVVPPGYHEQVFLPLAPLNVGYAGPAEAAALRRLGVNRIILHEEAFPPKVSPFPFSLTLRGFESSPWLRPVVADNPLWLFEVLDRPRPMGETAPMPSSPVAVFLQGESGVMNPAGREKSPALSGGAGAVGADPAHAVVSGPGNLYPPGRYRAAWRLDGIGGGPFPGALMRLRDAEGALIGEMRFPPGAATETSFHEFVFSIERPRRLVFELFPRDGGIRVDYLYLRFDDGQDPPRSVAFTDAPHIGRIVTDPGGASGRVLNLRAGVDPTMAFSVGPNRRLPPGRWRVSVWYRLGPVTKNPAPAVSADQDALRGGGRLSLRTVEGQLLRSIDLDTDRGGYVPATMEIVTAEGLFLDLGVAFSGSRDLYIDRLEITPA